MFTKISRWLAKRKEERFLKKMRYKYPDLVDEENELPRRQYRILKTQYVAYLLSLPHSPKDDHDEWVTYNGDQKLMLKSGELEDESGDAFRLKLPSRKYARLAMIFILQELQKSSDEDEFSWELDMGSNLQIFLETTIGIASNGDAIDVFKDELDRVLTAKFDGSSFIGNVGFKDKRHKIRISKTELTQNMRKIDISLSDDILRDLKNSYEIDLYVLLAEKTKRRGNYSESIKWEALHSLNGQGVARLRKYRENVRDAHQRLLSLDSVQKYFPKINTVNLDDNENIVIRGREESPPVFP